ncbi:DNA cytosine methyltransferase, partial [Pseudogracilibacillus sp. SO30301A]|uniref:DNA cytosine methyltransferase n=1 Tax=Pseudogracilibacillus sp. SO30301A TaxID=3098291 RepID=UPI00300E0CCE
MAALTLGSLFDGIGVFPLAASRWGITPIWASEIEKAPVSITKRHFLYMLHLGDITKIDGGKIPPVHIITFGSPCQNLL